MTLPAAMLLPAARVASAAQHVLPFHVAVEYEGALILYNDMACDDSRARGELGIEPRSLDETFGDAVHWLAEAGHITARQAGKAVS